MAKFTRRFKKYKNKTIKGGAKFWPLSSKKAQPINNSSGKLWPWSSKKAQPINNSSGKQLDTVTTTPETVSDQNQVTNTPETVSDENQVTNTPESVSDQPQVTNTPETVSEPENVTGDQSGNNSNADTNAVISTRPDTTEVANKLVSETKNVAREFNETLSNEECENKTKQAVQDALNLGWDIVDAAKAPVDKLASNTVQSFQNAIPKLEESFAKSTWNAIGTLPPLNIATNVISVANNMTDAARIITNTVKETAESASNIVSETKNNLKNLRANITRSNGILNRTEKSINQFVDPMNSQNPANSPVSQSGGVNKTRRRLFKHKLKTRRVRFSI
jgi:hypothetical protein